MSKYDDIIHLSRPVSEKRVRMPLADRAAQFSPFAALTGYDAIIAETGRRTERCVDLDEGAIAELNDQLRRILAVIDTRPVVTVTYFQPDKFKDGGSYETKTGPVRKIDTNLRLLHFVDRTEIAFEQLLTLHMAR